MSNAADSHQRIHHTEMRIILFTQIDYVVSVKPFKGARGYLKPYKLQFCMFLAHRQRVN